MGTINGSFAPVSRGIINRREVDRDRLKFIVQESAGNMESEESVRMDFAAMRERGYLEKIYPSRSYKHS